jgi:hypothetical protein
MIFSVKCDKYTIEECRSDRANKDTSRAEGIHSPVPIQVIGNVKFDHHMTNCLAMAETVNRTLTTSEGPGLHRNPLSALRIAE